MITLHSMNETKFDNIGIGVLMPSSCTVTEELNGEYELEMVHHRDKFGKWKRIQNDLIICADTPRGKQAFRIYRIKPDMESITVNARHIFYDLLGNFIENAEIVNSTATGALSRINSSCAVDMGFTYLTDITNTGSLSLNCVNTVTALADDKENSFLTVFGGELLRDNKNISILNAIGEDRGFSIRYGKNLAGLEVTEDMEEVYTRVYGKGKDGLTLPEKYIDSPYINNYPYPKIYLYEDNNIKTVSELRKAINSLFDNGIDIPIVNIKVDFQTLKHTAEYKNYSILENIQLGDIVTVINNNMNFHKKAKVIAYEYDCILNKYTSVELGDFIADITASITKGEKTFSTALTASNDARKAVSMISGGITVSDNALYVCIDNFDYTQSKRLFKFGSMGLQFTNEGINGQWQTIIDTEGNITQI